MRIKNRYIRNRSFRVKHWKRIRNAEHPYRTFSPYDRFGNRGYWYKGRFYSYDAEAQIKRHFEWIDKRARYMESGTHKHGNAAAWFRRQLNTELRAEQRAALNKVRHGDYDALFPVFKKDANWLWT
jgi:hypothetical protein